MSGAEIVKSLGLSARAVPDFPDALVALKLLAREGDGPRRATRTRRKARSSSTATAPRTSAASSRWRTRASTDSGRRSRRRSRPARRRTRSSTRASRCSRSCTRARSASSSSWMRWPASRPGTSRRSPRSSTSPSTRRCATSAVPRASCRVWWRRRIRTCAAPSFDLPCRAAHRDARGSPSAGLATRVTAVGGDFFADAAAQGRRRSPWA